MTQEMVGIERVCESEYKGCISSCAPQTKPVEPQDKCTSNYQACVTSVDTSIPGEIEKCVEPYNKCLGYPMQQQAPSELNQQMCEQQYSKCVKEDPSNPDLMYKCKIVYSQCVGNPMSVCGNGICEQNEEWKTCPSDCKSPEQSLGSCVAFYNVEEQKTIIVEGQKFLLRYEGERGPLSEPVDSKTRWHEILVTVNNNLYSIDNINHKPTPLSEPGFFVTGYVSDFDQYNQPLRADICIKSLKSDYTPPSQATCPASCKDSYSYCINRAPFEVGQVWAEKLNDNSIRFGAKVVEMTKTGSSTGGPSLNVNVIVSLDGKGMKLAYDEKSAYYYSEPLREELTGQHKLSARISKVGLGSVGIDHVIDFSGKINEWTAPPTVGMFPYAGEGTVYTIEKPTADYQAILEKQCSEVYNQCTQGCGYGSVPPVSTCEDKCASTTCGTLTVMPITGSVKLRYSETATVSGNGFSEGENALYVSFQDVDDSRCPPNADCIREGQVSAKIYAQHGTQEFVRLQGPVDLVLGQPTKYTVDGETLVFTLKELVSSGKKEDYVAVIDVEGAGSGADCKIQYKQCIERCKGKPYPAIPPMIPPMIVCDNSCYSESLSKCIPYGIRLVEKDASLYCGISGDLEKQKEPGAAAQNNYECKSNAATDGQCLNIQEQLNILQKIWGFFASIF